MITVIYCTKTTKPEHKEHLIKSSGLHKKLEVIEIINNGESLTKSYNRGLKQAKNDIVVFCHDDIIIETKQWGKKLIKQFKVYKNVGIIGVAGSKHINKTGKWWDDKKTMYGRVKHTHNNKTWLSKYSSDQGNKLEETLNIDGVWFAIQNNRIKSLFDENINGFHFYDIDFSFNNHLLGVGVAVTTNIRINHQSIGQTNSEWEENRLQFIDKFKDSLPLKLEENFNGSRKLKVMIPQLTKDGKLDTMIKLGGELIKLGVNTTIITNLNNRIILQCKQNNVKFYDIKEPPNFIIGDGVNSIQTQNGPVLTEVNKLYKTSLTEYDVILVENNDLFEAYKKMYPECKIINTSSEEYSDMVKTADNYKKLLIKTYNG